MDDHPGVARQIANLLPERFDVVAALENPAELLEATNTHRPDVILLDITLPGMDGIELASRLHSTGHVAKVVFLTVHDDADYARAGFAVGGTGYVVKTRLATDLAPALEAAVNGMRYISPGKARAGLRSDLEDDNDFTFAKAENDKGTTK